MYKSTLAIFVFFVLAYSLFSIGHFAGDGYQDYLTAESIVLDGNLSLNDRPHDKDELNYISVKGVIGKDGKVYSSRGGLGVPLILSLFYFIGNAVAAFFKHIPHDFITMLFCSFANPVVSAVNCLLIYVICGYLEFENKVATAITFIYGFTTMAPVYSRTGFTEPALVLFMLLAFYLILKYRSNPNPAYLLCAGISTAMFVFTKPSGIIFVPIFAFYTLSVILDKQNHRLKIKDVSAYAAPVAALFLLILTYNYWIYGSIFNFGRHNVGYFSTRIATSTHFLKGLYYYLLSTGKGFFIFNTALVLMFAVVFAKWQERRKEYIFFILIFVVNLLFYVKSFRRGSLFSWGPRYLLPSVPFLIFFIGEYIERYRSLFAQLLLIFLSAIGFLVVLPCMFINQSKFYFFVTEKLHLDEYLINFIPDLSPVLGAWRMFISRLAEKLLNITIPFIFSPDYRFVPEVTATMDGYNYFDLWFLKIISYAPVYRGLVIVILGIMVFSLLACLAVIIKNLQNMKTNEG